MKRVHLFTIAQLHNALGQFLDKHPELADHRILMDGREEFANWDGSFEESPGLTAVVMGYYSELWYNEEEEKE